MTRVTFSNPTPQGLLSEVSTWLGGIADQQGRTFNFYFAGMTNPVHTPDFALWFCDVFYDKVESDVQSGLIVQNTPVNGKDIATLIPEVVDVELEENKRILDQPKVYNEDFFEEAFE